MKNSLLNNVSVNPAPWCDGGSEETNEDAIAMAMMKVASSDVLQWVDYEPTAEVFLDVLNEDDIDYGIEICETIGGYGLCVPRDAWNRAAKIFENYDFID